MKGEKGEGVEQSTRAPFTLFEETVNLLLRKAWTAAFWNPWFVYVANRIVQTMERPLPFGGIEEIRE